MALLPFYPFYFTIFLIYSRSMKKKPLQKKKKPLDEVWIAIRVYGEIHVGDKVKQFLRASTSSICLRKKSLKLN